MTVNEIRSALWELAPEQYKESWDNIGLLCGRADAPVSGILIALDATEAVADEAKRLGCELVVTHHPLIFRAMNSVSDQSVTGRTVLRFIEQGISVISMHTNLDCAPGGVNDVLAARLGLRDVQVLEDGETAGLIRVGTVAPQPLGEFAAGVKAALGCPGLRYTDGGSRVQRVAVGGGSCSEFLERVKAAGCDTFVTADVKYHAFCDAKALGVNLIDAGHFETENPVCQVILAHLTARFPTLRITVSAAHGGCISYL